MSKSSINLTTRQVMSGFNVSDMTIYTWRQGTASRDPLPVVKVGRNVSFKESDMKAYAKKHGYQFDEKAAAAVAAPAALGPKAKVAVKKVVEKKAKATTVSDLPVKKVSRSKKAKAAVENRA